jgi:glycosyltransferase involved in cell wall biosynthesis
MLQFLAQKLHVAGAIKFLPLSIDLETMFAAMDIFAFPSHEEPLGSAVLAAMAHALPVAAFARGGIPEVVEAEKNGLLAKDLNPGAFSSLLVRLVEHPHEAMRLGKAARETILARFSANRMVEETLRLYEHLVAANSSLNSRI